MIYRGRDYVENEVEPFVEQISLELGSGLLSLVDSNQNAPLVEIIDKIRKELAYEMGFVIPGVELRDNLNIPPFAYLLRIKGIIYLKEEIYLDKYFALGSMEKLGKYKGWSLIDPVFKVQGKWVESSDSEDAEKEGLMVFGPLAIMTEHIKQVLKLNYENILGLQEINDLLEHLEKTHPKVVEDFLNSNYNLRKLRQILLNLLSESVPINNMITILEVIGDNLDKIKNTDYVTEIVRMKLARQICQLFTNEENLMKVICFNKQVEFELLEEVNNNKTLFSLKIDKVDQLLSSIRKTINEYPNISVLMIQTPIRLSLSKLISKVFPYISVIGTTEVPADIKVQVVAEINYNKNE